MEFKNYFDILGLKRSADLEEIKLAYRRLSKKYHPDLNEGNALANEKFIEIQEAYKSLTDSYNKSKRTYTLQNEFYNTEIDTLRKISPHLRWLENKKEKEFIPHTSKRLMVAIWISLGTVAGLLAVHFASNKHTSVQYTTADFTNFQLSETLANSEANTAIFLKSDTELISENKEGAIFRKSSGKNSVSYNYPIDKKTDVPTFKTIEDFLSIKSHNELVSFFGTEAAKKSIYISTAGVSYRSSVLQVNQDKKVIFVWANENDYQKISFIITEINNRTEELKYKKGPLQTKQGIYLGMSLKELQKLNANPVYFYGWGSGYDGVLASIKTGIIDFKNLTIKLSCENCGKKYYAGGKFSSADNTVDKENIFVYSITIKG